MKSLNVKQFKIKKIQPIYKGRVFTLNRVNVRARDGRLLKHDIISHGGAAIIVPVLNDGKFVMIHQYRTATNKIMIEFPAGTLEKGEAPLMCAKREIIEEIGYEAKRWRKLASFYPAPGVSSELMHMFLARDLRLKYAKKDHDEYLEPIILSFKQVKKLVFEGKIDDAKTILGFFYYSQFCDKR